MKTVHKYLGIVIVIIFLFTGVYMKFGFPGLYKEDEIIRYTFRANHVYILLAGLVNIVLGIYLHVQPHGRKRFLQFIGSALILAAPILLVVAFFFEAPLGTPERYMTSIGIFTLFVGVICHVPGIRSSGESDRSHYDT